jgi:hypothetical protein
MRLSRKIRTLAVALLSLGFLGHFPSQESSRHVAGCADTSIPTVPASSLTPFPAGVFSFVQDEYTRQAAEAYSMYVRALQWNVRLDAGINTFSVPSFYGYPSIQFPTYQLPGIDRVGVDLRKPDVPLIWGGLPNDPALQYLVRPAAPSTPTVASAAGGLNGFVALRQEPTVITGTLSVGNAGINSAKF